MDATNTAGSNTQHTTSNSAYDEPYRFGRKPTTQAPFPFTERQFVRLLIVRSRLQATPSEADLAEAA